MNKMIYSKRPLILFFGFAAFLLLLFSTTNLKSYEAEPPAYRCNDPNPYAATSNCTFCHSSFTAFHDSTNFILQMGTDTLSLAEVTSGVTTYTPGVTYFMRIKTASPSAVHGFELTAEDTTLDQTASEGTEVTNFAIIDATNTSLISATYNFVAHHNANSNNQWTFTWTAPTTYEGPVTFYYAGNDGVAGDTNFGDSIFVATKTIGWSGINGVANIASKLSSLSAFPTVFDQDIQIAFNLKDNAMVTGSIVNLNGQVVKTILNEGLTAGSYSRSYNLNNLAAGIYLVKVQIGDAYAIRKIVKE